MATRDAERPDNPKKEEKKEVITYNNYLKVRSAFRLFLILRQTRAKTDIRRPKEYSVKCGIIGKLNISCFHSFSL